MIVISQSFIIIHLMFIMVVLVVAMPSGMAIVVKGLGFALQRTTTTTRRITISLQNPQQQHAVRRHHLFTARFHNSRSCCTTTTIATTRQKLFLAASAEEEDGLSSFSSPVARDFSTIFQNPSIEKEKMTRSLLSTLIQRSSKTLAYKSSLLVADTSTGAAEVESNASMNENYDNHVRDNNINSLFAVDRAVQDTLDTVAAAVAVAADDDENANNNNKNNKKQKVEAEEEVRVGYNQNPTITSTALAHVLWSHVLLKPNVGVVDSHKNLIAIDATAGNGADSVALARMIFLQDNNNNNNINNNKKLICIDLQPEACETTRSELAKILPRDVLENQVDIHQGSHAASLLPLLDKNTNNNNKNVALVVYNLGFLPNSTSSILTCTESTILSMADAVLSIRIGGLLSVMTYPRTNREEDWAVHVFLEGLALFSSQTDDWQEFVSTSFSSSTSSSSTTTTTTVAVSMETHRQQEAVRQLILETLMRVKNEGAPNQTWRVHEYKKLGWRDAPILLTASRIK